MFNRQIQSVSPLPPGAEIISHVGITDEPQREVGMGRAVGSLAMRYNVLVRADVLLGIHPGELVGRFEETLLVEIIRPFQVDGAGNGPAAARADELTGVLGVASSVDD